MAVISRQDIDGTAFEPGALECLEGVLDDLRARALAASRLYDALWYGKLYGEVLTSNFTGCFSDDFLEQALYEKWIAPEEYRSAEGEPVDILFVASALYDTGGHTRLLRMLVAECARRNIRFQILLTGKTRNSTRQAFQTDLGGSHSLDGALSDKMGDIISTGRNAGLLVFLHHPFDLAAALAARKLTDLGCNTLLINHSDHTFGFGHGAVKTVCEICAVGWRTTAGYRTARTQSFLGIPVVDDGADLHQGRTDRSGPIVSVGDPSKYNPHGALDFPSFAERMLEAVPNDIEIVGPDASDPHWQAALRRYPGRLRLRGLLPFPDVTELLGRASCYVDSFPLDGGTIFPQALVGGLTVFGPNRQSAPGVSFADGLRFDTMGEMEQAMIRFLREGEEMPEQAAARRAIVAEFNAATVFDRLLSAAKAECRPLPQEFATAGRDSLYNKRRWEKAGQVLPPKATWRDAQTALRLRFALSLLMTTNRLRGCRLRKRMILNSLFRY